MWNVRERCRLYTPNAGAENVDQERQCVGLQRSGEGLGNASEGFHFYICFKLKKIGILIY